MINKIFVFVLCFAILDIIREMFLLRKSMKLGSLYNITKTRLLGLGLALSYVLTIIFTGI